MMPGNHGFHLEKPPDQLKDSLLTKKELAEKMGLPSTRIVDAMIAHRKIPVIRLGYRTVRFRWNDVQAAIEKLTIWDHSASKENYGRSRT